VLPLPQVEAFIKKACKSSLQQFDKWWQVHKDEVPLDTMAQVNVIIATSTDTPNRIVYSLARPLAYDDFAGDYTVKQGDEAAVTASGIGIEYKSSVEHSKLVVNVKLIPVFFKNNSWFKPEAKIENVLAHEQTHFDITAIKTCEFAARIRAATFTKNDYDKLLQAYLDEFTRITKDEEDKYDAETNHGLVRDKQIEWQEKVKAKLKEVGCY
jgi:hypothetical protein